MRAIIPAAGLGTRLLPATLTISKELLPLGRYPALAGCLLEAMAARVSELLVVLSPHKRDLARLLFPATWEVEDTHEGVAALRRLVEALPLGIVTQEEPLGTLDAIERGRALFEDPHAPCAILYPDLIHLPDQTGLRAIIAAHLRSQQTVYGLYRADERRPGLHGPSARIIPVQGADVRPGGMVQVARVLPPGPRPEPGELRTTLGAVHSAACHEMLETTRASADGPQEDRNLLGALDRLAGQGGLYGVLLEGEVLDLGTLPGYLDAVGRFASGRERLRDLPP